MLRKISNIIVSFLLLVSTTGFSISVHYCGEDLVSIKIDGEAKSCCENGMCCHTDSEFVQLDADFLFTSDQVNLENTFIFDIAQLPLELLFQPSGIENVLIPLNRYEYPPPPDIITRLVGLQTFLL